MIMAQFKMLFIFVLGGLFTIFVLQNTDVVSVRFLAWELSMSRIVLLPVIFAIGVIVGMIIKWKWK